jgi:DNA-binding LytR/AlgR family response regulator
LTSQRLVLADSYDPERSVRVHRSAIVNLAFVREIDRAEVRLTTGARVPLARERFRALVAHLERR